METNGTANNTTPPELSPTLLSEAQARELAQRMAEDDAAPDDVVRWETVKAKILAHLPKP